jgi:hypothetical protein
MCKRAISWAGLATCSVLLAAQANLGAPPGDPGRQPPVAGQHAAAAGEPGAPTSLDVVVDPDLPARDWDVAALRHEARGTGRLHLGDGDFVSGRVVAEGIEILPGATVYVEEGAQIISVEDLVLAGTIVIVEQPGTGDPDPAPSDEDELDLPRGGAGLSLPGAPPIAGVTPPPPSCPTVKKTVGRSGRQPAAIELVFVQDSFIQVEFGAGACAFTAPAAMQVPPAVVVAGTRSAIAVGGKGGAGADIVIEGIGLAGLTIAGPVCNTAGGPGGSATATGVNGPPCDCGGDALAIGGPGGRAGNLTIVAQNIDWVAGSSLTVNAGGPGGPAVATGGQGGHCNVCGGAGGAGGDAVAVGGAAGGAGRVHIGARGAMWPAPATVLAGATLMPGAAGGGASAVAGNGGNGGGGCPCAADGGPGGPGGNAYALGGTGGAGVMLQARRGSPIGLPIGTLLLASDGSNGGPGGTALALAGTAGNGAGGGTCPCWLPVIAGDGGDGGAGGSAWAEGGRGGAADDGPLAVSIGAAPTTGAGGGAIAACGNGGNGGNGGDCASPDEPSCVPGAGGLMGPGGAPTAVGGAPGAPGPFGNALIGPAGAALALPCGPGFAGAAGLLLCDQTGCLPDGGDCCEANGLPGCNDAACCSAVCANDPFCCEVSWDHACAGAAASLCAVCQAAGGCPGPGDCFVPHATPGCQDAACCQTVCGFNPFCCEVTWDFTCVQIAHAWCGP